MEIQIVCFILVGCVFAVSAAPANSRRQDIQHLVSLISNIQNLSRIRQTLPSLTNIDTENTAKISYIPELTDLPGSEASEDEESLKKGFLGKPTGPFSKRQGAWSYDYGLGGGRFGKRNYGDYGIGGGRFGRDVDHVDLSDASDAEMSS
ncbi:unnamed protein product [Candidula unifasciata]|uniref:Cholecystokinin n=1 Tax=Candidula unifasciata TaxID=100452 RepID=A0A8S4A909_9EUPU|nr:unnamed protein product [Candidula unifasciata]